MINKLLFSFSMFALVFGFGVQNLGAQTSGTLSGVTLTPNAPMIQVGNSVQLTPSFTNQNGGAFTGSGTNVTYVSSNPSVATVTNTGNVTGASTGTATITATATNGSQTASGTSTVTVSTTPPNFTLNSMTLTPSIFTLPVGGTQQLNVSTLNQNALPISATTTYVSSNPSIATVTSGGIVTGIASGTATITATSTNGNTLSRTATVTVTGTAGIATFPAGCASGWGYSVINGTPCSGTGTAITSTSISGCPTPLGYSTTTGTPCSGTNIAISHLAGCATIFGRSTINNQPCNGTSVASIPGTGGPGLPTTGNGNNTLMLLLIASGVIGLSGSIYLIRKHIN